MKKIICLFLVATTLAFGVEGRVAFVEGLVHVKRSGKTHAVKLGASVKEGDTLSTSANGKVGILLSDGASFLMRPSSTLEIRQRSEYYQADGTISMLFHNKSEKAKSRWAIKTPIVTAGVRGTGFTVEASKTKTRLVLFTGKVIMTDFVKESGLQDDPNLMMQDFLNDVELNAGTAFVYEGGDVKKTQVDLQKDPMQKLHAEHIALEKSAAWKKATR